MHYKKECDLILDGTLSIEELKKSVLKRINTAGC
jgi:hypothetical protein